jgi:very-short-patch-repair endonuclease
LFDEASQVRPEYAVGAMIRTDQIILAGDRHQLPPTRFFDALDGDYFDEDIDEFESILNECDAAGFPSKSLLWHYRSQDESLIAFSNFHFYNNQLYTFPSASPNENDTGLEFVHVPGAIYRRGRGGFNLDEARRVSDFVVEHFETKPEASLGVVTFSEAQRAAIEQELETRLRSLPALQPLAGDEGPEPFFVKSLEQVQGDERDVMIFSVGYGFDEGGRFTMNFGPLSKSGGERRLNVAITRAKRKVLLVSSIQPEDIDLRRASAKGAQLLHNYMLASRDGVKSMFAQVDLDPEASFGSPFEESVHDSLVARGLSLEKQVGVSAYRIDLAVVDQDKPGRFLLGIECDGAMYHSAATARDRDRIRQQVLEGLGWRIHRIWSRDWIENRGREIEKVLTSVKGAIDGTVSSNPHPKNTLSVTEDSQPHQAFTQSTREITSSDLPPNSEFYVPIRLQRQGRGSEEFHGAPNIRLMAAVEKVVELEGPIHIKLARKRVADAWGLGRVGRRIQESIDIAVGMAKTRRTVEQKGEFLWPPGLRRPTVRVAKAGQAIRSIDEIPLEELVEAAHICTTSALSIERDDLARETAKLFGLRATRNASASIEMAIDSLLQEGRIVWRGNKLRLPRN